MNTKIYLELQKILRDCPSLMSNKPGLIEMCNVRFDVPVESPTVEAIDHAVKEKYFTKVWHPKQKKYKYSGLAIVDEINQLRPRSVLDVGCGYNEFKGKINNLYGIDLYNTKADERVDIMDYKPEQQHDVLICFGSINFGNVQKVFSELQKCVEITEPGGLLFFRVNPGIQHDPLEAKWIEFFEWSPEFIFNSAKEVGCSVVNMRNDANRIYFVLRKDK